MSLRRTLLFVLRALALIMVGSGGAWAQSSPDWMWLTWNGNGVDTLVQGDCYDLNAGPNAGGMTLDILWSVNGGPAEYIGGWPTLNAGGQAANICTSAGTPLGLITFLEIRNAAGGPWRTVNYPLNMLPQAAGASFNGSQGYAGVDGYIFTVNGLYERSVRVRYNHDATQGEEGMVWVDVASNYHSGVFDHYSFLGEYVITAVQDAASQPDNWTPVYAPYTILPPQPQSLSASPSTVVAGATNGSQLYNLSAINGGGMSLDLRYAIWNQGQAIWGTEYFWPWMYPNGPNGWNGLSGNISVAKCTRPGNYNFYQVKNSLHGDGDWANVNAWLTVTGSGQPTISSSAPAGALKGQSVIVTIFGKELCGVSLQTTYPGLSFSNINNPNWSDGTSFTATFTVAPNAVPGNAVVTVVTRGGNKTLTFGIVQNGALPTVTSATPPGAPPGSNVSVTMAGTNLYGAVLSTTWTGLTFSNVVTSSNGTSLTATFAISSSAATGTPVIKVTTPAGFVNTTKFSIGTFAPGLSREYIYLGNRVIAVESP
jgi:hypothetical protein